VTFLGDSVQTENKERVYMALVMIMRIIIMAGVKFAPITREFGWVAVVTINLLKNIAWYTPVLSYHIG
jgi:hypothetical protein